MTKKIGIDVRFWKEKCSPVDLYNVIRDKVDITDFDVISPEVLHNDWEEISAHFNDIETENILITGKDTMESVEVSWGNRFISFISVGLNVNRIDYSTLLEDILLLDGLLTIHVYDSEYAYWQSADTTQRYHFANKSYNHLRVIKDPLGIGRECLDISGNYGRFVTLYRERTMAAPINYYGNMFFELIPKEYIKKFKSFHSYEERDTYIKCVLFPEIFESEKNSKKQEEYFKYLKLQQLSDLIGDIYGVKGVPYDKEIDIRIKQMYQ